MSGTFKKITGGAKKLVGAAVHLGTNEIKNVNDTVHTLFNGDVKGAFKGLIHRGLANGDNAIAAATSKGDAKKIIPAAQAVVSIAYPPAGAALAAARAYDNGGTPVQAAAAAAAAYYGGTYAHNAILGGVGGITGSGASSALGASGTSDALASAGMADYGAATPGMLTGAGAGTTGALASAGMADYGAAGAAGAGGYPAATMLGGGSSLGAGLSAAGSALGGASGGAAGSGGFLSQYGPLIGAGLNIAGGLMQANSANDASNTLADAQVQAAKIAADAAKFRPVGVATRFGGSSFQYDKNGNLINAGYAASPLTAGLQSGVETALPGMLSEFTNSPITNASLAAGAHSAYNLGNQYLTTSPQAQAAKYMSDQQALLAPSRQTDLANLQNTLQNSGRSGLSMGGMTDGSMTASNPEMQAYYNSLRMQDLGLAANATQGGMDYANFGSGMLNSGAGMMSNFYGLQSSAAQPFNTGLGIDTTLEGLAQNPMDLGINIGAKGTAANTTSGQLLANGMTNAAKTMYPANAYNPWAYTAGMLGNTIGKNYATGG